MNDKIGRMSQEQLLDIATGYDSTGNARLFAKKYDISTSLVRKIARLHGIAIKPKNALREKTSEAEKQEIVSRYLAGERTSVLVKRFGVGEWVIVRVLKRAGVAIKSRSQRRRDYVINEEAFDGIPTDADAVYWIGFLYADGYVYKSKSGNLYLGVRLAKQDEAHLDKLRLFLGSNHPIREVLQTGMNKVAADFSFSCRPLIEKLMSHGLTERKSLTAVATAELATNPNFWRGCVDGDGWVGWGKGKMPRIGLCGSVHLVTQFADFIRSVFPAFHGHVHKMKREHCHMISVCGRGAVALIQSLRYDQDAPSLTRKKDVAIECLAWKPKFNMLLPHNRTEAATRHKAGESIKDLAASFGVKYQAMWRCLHEQGVSKPRWPK